MRDGANARYGPSDGRNGLTGRHEHTGLDDSTSQRVNESTTQRLNGRDRLTGLTGLTGLTDSTDSTESPDANGRDGHTDSPDADARPRQIDKCRFNFGPPHRATT